MAGIGTNLFRSIQTRVDFEILLLLIAVLISGFGTYAVSFVNDTRDNLPFASVTRYDRFGREVFLREGEGIVHNVQDELLYESEIVKVEDNA